MGRQYVTCEEGMSQYDDVDFDYVNGTADHITDTGGRKTPLVTDGGTKHNMFRVTQTLR